MKPVSSSERISYRSSKEKFDSETLQKLDARIGQATLMTSTEWKETKLKVKPANNKLVERVIWINFTI
jgi:hypothetical protein